MFNPRKQHLIPPIVENLVQKLQEKNNSEVRERFAEQIESIRDYCGDAIAKYQSETGFKRKG